MRLLLILSLIFTISCSSNAIKNRKFDTTFNYVIAPEASNKTQLQKVIIASVNYLDYTPLHLRKKEHKVDNLIVKYLRQNEFEVLTGSQFKQAWATAVHKHGEYYNPYSASFRRDRFNAILTDVLISLKNEYAVDAIIFTDLVSRNVTFNYKSPHYASWDGVQRRPRIKTKKRIPRQFNWSFPFNAVSLNVTIIRADNKLLFNSVGGLEVTDDLYIKLGKPVAKRNRAIFQDTPLVKEGIAIALHPFIKMPDYPGE